MPQTITDGATADPLAFPDGYYAVPDPEQPDNLTYWRRSTGKTTKFVPWQSRQRYGPVSRVMRSDIPTESEAKKAFLSELWDANRAYLQTVYAAIAADLPAAQLRFAAETIRCYRCGRELFDNDSRLAGMGADCRGAR